MWATAMTPVIVALVKEAVERPAKRVSSIASRAAAPPLARATRAVAEPPPEAYAPPPPVVGPDPGLSEMRVYRRERATGRRWKLAIITGLLACVIAIAAMTLQLVAGRSVVCGSHDTTIFGGHRSTSTSTTKTKTDEKKTTTTDQTCARRRSAVDGGLRHRTRQARRHLSQPHRQLLAAVRFWPGPPRPGSDKISHLRNVSTPQAVIAFIKNFRPLFSI